jgi:hypothetical protein
MTTKPGNEKQYDLRLLSEAELDSAAGGNMAFLLASAGTAVLRVLRCLDQIVPVGGACGER